MFFHRLPLFSSVVYCTLHLKSRLRDRWILSQYNGFVRVFKVQEHEKKNQLCRHHDFVCNRPSCGLGVFLLLKQFKENGKDVFFWSSICFICHFLIAVISGTWQHFLQIKKCGMLCCNGPLGNSINLNEHNFRLLDFDILWRNRELRKQGFNLVRNC